ncbi:DUF3783 domain-containing protein [Lacrimispora algidixylanolytica]|uniref:DUF3783 domain-containing protein n=1 Tax=Lacrimispora algidixylanolytica TaxID=94868 RepID=A0A419T5L2_9FIRM|nr:DUF3783 domain-containing protein [Lacrimispora algidixylanolytica]RKD32820.1 hypothetical protein BET01_16405 [Lacrimispora algidixylanolytica]
MAITKELVLYYQPEEEKKSGNDSKAAKLKAVLIRMGIRIRNISSDQINQTVGYLAGMEGFDETALEACPPVEEEILVMKNFSNRRVDELLLNIRRAGVPKVQLKAVITDTNCKWRFYDLYEELKQEHEAMSNIPKS